MTMYIPDVMISPHSQVSSARGVDLFPSSDVSGEHTWPSCVLLAPSGCSSWCAIPLPLEENTIKQDKERELDIVKNKVHVSLTHTYSQQLPLEYLSWFLSQPL